jgi:hypothetical protein
LDGANPSDRLVERRSHPMVHFHRVGAFDEMRYIAVAHEQRLQLLVADPCEDRGIGNLVAVEIEDRQHGAVAHRVDELVGMPRRGKRSRLRLAVAHHARDDEVGVIEGGTVRVRQAVPELAASWIEPGVSGVTCDPM